MTTIMTPRPGSSGIERLGKLLRLAAEIRQRRVLAEQRRAQQHFPITMDDLDTETVVLDATTPTPFLPFIPGGDPRSSAE